MRILITTFTYPPNKDGVAEACRMLAEGLAAHGWDVTVATGMGDRPQAEPLAHRTLNGVRILDHHLGQGPGIPAECVPAVDAYRDLAVSPDFDIVITQCWDARPTKLLLPVLSRIPAKLVMVSHGYAAHLHTWHRGPTLGLGWWFRGLRYTAVQLPRMIRAYDRIVFLSRRTDFGRFFDHKVTRWMRHPGISVIANSVPFPGSAATDHEFRKRHGIGEGPMALCVANYSDRKNQILALKAFRAANVPGSTLVFIGSEFNAYARMVIEADRELARVHPDCHVVFLEKLRRDETFDAFIASDFFLLTAKAETQPIVLIEAMATGKPWLSTDTGCVAEMPGGIVRGNQRGLVEGIRSLCSDSELREKLGAEGRRGAVEEFAPEPNLAKYKALLEQLAPQTTS